MNPAGIAYRVACFREAPGAVGWGEASEFFSWFRGTAWQIALCAACRAHVGWGYRRDSGGFYGLIVERVI